MSKMLCRRGRTCEKVRLAGRGEVSLPPRKKFCLELGQGNDGTFEDPFTHGGKGREREGGDDP